MAVIVLLLIQTEPVEPEEKATITLSVGPMEVRVPPESVRVPVEYWLPPTVNAVPPNEFPVSTVPFEIVICPTL